MLNWKRATKQYREVATQAMTLLRFERELRAIDEAVVDGAELLRDLVLKPKTPFVPLVTGEDINVQKAQQNLIKLLAVRDKVIQSYSQNNPQKLPTEKLDNTLPV